MKKITPHIITLGLLLIISGCSILPFSKNVKVRKTPKTIKYGDFSDYELKDGSPFERTWWMCFSDRANTTTQLGPGNDMPLKKLGFAEPLYITKEENGFVKLAEYQSGTNLVATKGKLEKKSVKSPGWIRKDRLLLWSSALKDAETGFYIKAITGLKDATALKQAGTYLVNDSLCLFNTPDLNEKTGKNVSIGSIVYLYKRAEDGKSFLIGNASQLRPDDAKQIMLGWISADVLSVWGTKSMFSLKPAKTNTQVKGGLAENNYGLYASIKRAITKDSLPILNNGKDLQDRLPFENIFPLRSHIHSGDSVIKTGILENVLDYSANKVYNVLGNPIYHARYKEILRNSKNVNVVFVLDVSDNNRSYFPYIATAIQDLQYYLENTPLFNQYRFGAVTYKQTRCKGDTLGNVLPLTSNYDNIVKFFEQKQMLSNCNDASEWQPLYDGLMNANALLQPYRDETNVVVVIGTTGNYYVESGNSINDVLTGISRSRSRLMMFQSISKSSDAYNDFVLSAEKIVVNSAQNLAELKKEKLVDLNDVLTKASYTLLAGDSGIYALDYPAKSMSQGFVLFPKKGEITPPGMLKKYFENLMLQIVNDNQKINATLRTYFKKIGIKNTRLNAGYDSYFDNALYPLPNALVTAFADEQKGFFIPAYTTDKPLQEGSSGLDYGLLLSQEELEKQIYQFEDIYRQTSAFETFNQKKACRKYRKFISTFTRTNGIIPLKKPKEMTLAESLYLLTGFIGKDSLSNNLKLGQLKNKEQQKVALDFFNGFKLAATNLSLSKQNPKRKIKLGTDPYYLINQKDISQNGN